MARFPGTSFAIGALAAVWVASFAPVSIAGRLEVVAATGQPAPDGNGTLNSFGMPYINDLGDVVFAAGLNDTPMGAGDDAAIYRWKSNALGLVARQGQSAPDGNGTVDGWTSISFNAAGEVAFLGTLAGAVGLDAGEGIFRSSPAAALAQVTRGGQAAPDALNTLNDFYPYVTMADNGQVVYGSTLRRISDGGPGGSAVFRSNGGPITEIAHQGQQISVDGEIMTIGAMTNSRPRGNASGQAYFGTGLSGNIGLFRGDGQSLSPLVITNVTPVIDHDAIITSPFWATLNNAGEIGFRGLLRGAGDFSSLFVASDDGVRVVMRGGQPLPDGLGNIDHFWWTNDHVLSLNDNRQLAFEALLTNLPGGQSDRDAILFGDGESLTEVVRVGVAAPDHDGEFADFFLVEVINDLDHVAFMAGVSNTMSGQFERGLFISSGAGIVQVARSGQLIDGVAMDAIGFRHGVEQARGLNNFDQLAFRATLTDGRQLILRYTPGPTLPGDYDLDGDVDPHDYLVWLADFGGTGAQNADGNGDGVVDAADYVVWRRALTAGAGSGPPRALPEPSGLLSASLAGLATLARCVHGRDAGRR